MSQIIKMVQVSYPLACDGVQGTVPRSARIGLALAILGALAICGLLWAVASVDVDRFYTPDSPEYVGLGRNLSAYWNPHDPLWGSAINRTPGYPLLIAGVFAAMGDHVEYVIATQILLFISSLYLVYRIAAELVDPKLGAIAACVLAVNPESNVFVIYLMNETLFTTVLLAATWIWLVALRKSQIALSFLAGLGLGITVMIRPAGMYLPLLLAPLFSCGPYHFWNKCLKASLYLLGVALPVGGWMIHHQVLTGTAFVTSIQSKDMLYFRAAGAVAEEQGVERWVAAASLAEQLWEPYGIRVSVAERKRLVYAMQHSEHHWVNRYFDGRVSSGGSVAMDSYRLAREEKRLAVRTLWKHPVGAIKTAGYGVVRLLGGVATFRTLRLAGLDARSDENWWVRTGYIAVALSVIGFSYLAAAGGVLWLLRTRQYSVCYVLMVFIAYFIAVSLGPTATTRYRIPMMPFVAILAAIGIAVCYRYRYQRKSVLQLV